MTPAAKTYQIGRCRQLARRSDQIHYSAQRDGAMTYVDGIGRGRSDRKNARSSKHAEEAANTVKENGAINVVECWAMMSPRVR
jgi:hypothetical protein